LTLALVYLTLQRASRSFLPDLRRVILPALRYPALFDGRLLLLGVPPLRGRHYGRVDDLPAHGKVPSVCESGIEAGK
jgi:hypothetical protein